MSLNGFLARAGAGVGKLVPSFGYGGTSGVFVFVQHPGCITAFIEPTAVMCASHELIGSIEASVEPATELCTYYESVGSLEAWVEPIDDLKPHIEEC